MNPSFSISPFLQRYPHRKRELLQAWDSADELILQHLSQVPLLGKRILIIGDSFGALSGALEGLDVTTYTDSFVSDQGIRLNSQNRIQPFSHLSEFSGTYDLALIRIPKNMSYFEDILCHLSAHLTATSKVVCGYMVKHQSNASFELLNRITGETSTSLAQKKARLIFADFQKTASPSPYPIQVPMDSFKIPFVNHSNLFSREKLDIGTRFLLEHIPQGDYGTILDLGCANGIIGIAAKRLNPQARIIFSDESAMAIQSARANYPAYFPDQEGDAEFRWTSCYENPVPGSVDLVICNPPFHQGNASGEFIAHQMFTDAYQALKPGGLLRVIGNSHLHYPLALKKIFGNSQGVAQNPKFTIVDAER